MRSLAWYKVVNDDVILIIMISGVSRGLKIVERGEEKIKGIINVCD